MTRSYKVYLQVHGKYLFELFTHEYVERIENIGVILLGLRENDVSVVLIVKQQLRSIMLPETVVAEQYVFARHICEHGIRPVEHGRLDKSEAAFSYIELIACLHVYEIPILMIQTSHYAFTFFGAVYGRVRYLAHELRQRSAVIVLVVVHDNIIYVLEIYLLLQTAHELLVIRAPHRINQNVFRIPYKVRIVR